MYINETIQKHIKTIQITVNTSTHITKTPTQMSKHPQHTLTQILQNKLKQPQYKLPNEIVTIQSSTLSIRSP
jgi:methionine-rich copper-binding protein CopC